MRNWLLRLLLPVALLTAGAIQAQDQQQDEQAAAQRQEQEQEQEQEQSEQTETQDEESVEEEAGEDGEFERFIPTEQVSRDLGVSFPADI